ncbi:MAG TPA: CHAP domain-containing protein [Kiritimatiellia bacterium]|nr:CHAP domain-containing protein [Saprospiraceae bacterium]HMP00662.1 CHAP domain-containing protein [Kiritimatiellia bacterium]
MKHYITFIMTVFGGLVSTEQDVYAQVYWKCNAYGTLHSQPSDCSDPAMGGTWVADRDDSISESSQKVLRTMYAIRPGASYGEVNCVEFVYEVLKKTGMIITPDIQRRIMVSEGELRFLANRVMSGSEDIQGAPSALVKSGQGTEVSSVSELKPGDIIQYWRKTPSGRYEGHAGIVERSYGNGKVDLYGSHRSLGGVGTLRGLDLTKTYRAYAARPEF